MLYLCPMCSRVSRGLTPDEAEVKICARCSTDHLALVRLYNQILRRYPALKNRNIVQVFQGLWEKHESTHGVDESTECHR